VVGFARPRLGPSSRKKVALLQLEIDAFSCLKPIAVGFFHPLMLIAAVHACLPVEEKSQLIGGHSLLYQPPEFIRIRCNAWKTIAGAATGTSRLSHRRIQAHMNAHYGN